MGLQVGLPVCDRPKRRQVLPIVSLASVTGPKFFDRHTRQHLYAPLCMYITDPKMAPGGESGASCMQQAYILPGFALLG